jgi:ferredoxin
MHVEVNAAKCVASGQCVLIAPEVFDQREDEGTVMLLDDPPAPKNHDRVREAALVCPSGAITLKELRCAYGRCGRFARSTTCSGRPTTCITAG